VQLVARRVDRELARLTDAQPHGPPRGADGRQRRAADNRRELGQRRRGDVTGVHRDPPMAEDGRRAGHERHHGEHQQRVEAGAPGCHRRAGGGKLRERPTIRVGAARGLASKGGDGDR